MAAIQPADDEGGASDLAVRAPRQRRTREQWDRILDAGVRLLEDGGYEAFTIAALCERAQVPPRALYARAATKDALFLAVYEHGMRRLRTSEQVFTDADRWQRDDYPRRIERAVLDLVTIFADNEDFLRSVVLISGAHPEVLRRGEAYREALGNLFTSVLAPPGEARADARALQEHEFCFSMVFAALVIRTAYGPNYGPAGDTVGLGREIVTMAQRYLLAPS
jgi:AcrR family transcriptional regulator